MPKAELAEQKFGDGFMNTNDSLFTLRFFFLSFGLRLAPLFLDISTAFMMYCSLSWEATSWKDGTSFQQILTAQVPDTPWHRHLVCLPWDTV